MNDNITAIQIIEEPGSPEFFDDIPWQDLLAKGVEHHFEGIKCQVVKRGEGKATMHLSYAHHRVHPATRKRVISFMQGFMLADAGVLHR